MGIIGELGTGKTLALTYLILKYHSQFKGRRPIFSNYKLQGVPYTYVEHPDQLDDLYSGFFAGDELWMWLDSRVSGSRRNRFFSSLLIRSRKRDLDVVYTCQSLMQMDVRVRRVTDFIALPYYNEVSDVCSVRIMTFPYELHVKTLKFRGSKLFPFFDTTEEIDAPISSKVDKPESKKKRYKE